MVDLLSWHFPCRIHGIWPMLFDGKEVGERDTKIALERSRIWEARATFLVNGCWFRCLTTAHRSSWILGTPFCNLEWEEGTWTPCGRLGCFICIWFLRFGSEISCQGKQPDLILFGLSWFVWRRGKPNKLPTPLAHHHLSLFLVDISNHYILRV